MKAAADLSLFPARSTALTFSVCEPDDTVKVGSVLHFLYFLPSRLQRYSTFFSFESNLKTARWDEVTEAGWLLILVFGGFLSTVNVRVAGVASTLPSLSTAATAKVCLPSLSLAVVYGVAQAAKAAPSTEHRKVEPASLEVKANRRLPLLDV